MESAKERAAKNLSFYFESLYEKAGLAWTLDNQAEIEDIVNDLVIAVAEEGAS